MIFLSFAAVAAAGCDASGICFPLCFIFSHYTRSRRVWQSLAPPVRKKTAVPPGTAVYNRFAVIAGRYFFFL
jgi:hypothetical protein